MLKNHKQIVKRLKTHKSTLVAGFLVTAIVLLLFGIFSQFQAPSTDEAPPGETSITYSTFLTQVNSGNVLAVTIRGNGVSVLLLRSASASVAVAKVLPAGVSPAQRKADIAAWTHYISSASAASWTSQASTIDAGRMVYTTMPADGADQLIMLLIRQHVAITTEQSAQSPAWIGVLLKFAPLVFLLVLVVMVLAPRKQARIPQNVNEQIAQFTKKRVKRFDSAALARSKAEPERKIAGSVPGKQKSMSPSALAPANSVATQPVRVAPSTTFADVAGIDEVRAELEEIVQFLRTPEKFARLGAHIPRGALLIGPPGTGKTLLARAVAGEAGVPFFSISASEFVEMFVGVGASRVRDLFAQARAAGPSVIFIDEIDAVGRKRSMRAMGSEERDQTLNQLLVELDGFNARQAVVVMAATNRVDILDKALLRPGRFDRRISVSLPDRVGRQAILHIHAAKTPLHEEVSLERLARLTTGMSGADLANLVNEAALCAARQDLDCLNDACFEDALARVQLGALRPLVMPEAERRIIAYHEGGHAIAAYYLKEADTVNRVTILPRGQSLGVTQFVAEEDRYNYSREMLMAKIAVGLAGRVAEELTLGREHVTTGAENDFQAVTSMARRMVTRWGMSEEVGVVFADYDEAGSGLNMCALDPSMLHARTLAYTPAGGLVSNGEFYQQGRYTFALAASAGGSMQSSSMAGIIEREVKKILDEGHRMALNLLQDHANQLHALANALMEREQLNRSEFEALMRE